jgi:hypothetical protein
MTSDSLQSLEMPNLRLHKNLKTQLNSATMELQLLLVMVLPLTTAADSQPPRMLFSQQENA